MTTAPESISTPHARLTTRAPRPLPAWLQVSVMVLLLVQGVQTALHFYSSQVVQTSPASSTERLSGFEYYYQPDRLNTAAPQARYDYDPYGRAAASLETTAIYTEVSILKLQDVHRRCHPSGQLAAPVESR